MPKDWVQDIADMHAKFGVNEAVSKMDRETLQNFYLFRLKCIREEFNELLDSNNPEDCIDAIIDLCVFAIGTLDAFNVDGHKAWDQVHAANMNKNVGIKSSRPNPLGLPDLIKPDDWVGPDHSDNYAILSEVFEKKTK